MTHTSPTQATRTPAAGSDASVAAIPADAAPDGPAAIAARLGARCGTCADGLGCLALPGGYCSSACDGAGSASCAGACVQTGTLGPICMASCASDADCRAAEGYTCDPIYHACALPNLAAIAPKQCAQDGQPIAHDDEFAPSEIVGSGRAPVAAIGPQGAVALFESRLEQPPAPATDLVDMWPPRAGDRGFAAAGDRSPAIASTRGGLLMAWRDQLAPLDVPIVQPSGSADWLVVDELGSDDDCGDCSAGPWLAASGDAVAILFGGDPVGLRVKRSRDGGKSFGPAQAAAIGTRGAAALDRAGALHLVTLRGDAHGAYGSAMQSIEYSFELGAPHVVSARDELVPTFFAAPALAVDSARRRVWIAYIRGGRDAVWDLVIAATRDGGKTWTRTALGGGCATHLVPALAVDPKSGVLHATWFDNLGHPARYAHATCTLAASGAPTCVDRGAISSQPFARFDLGRGGASSLSERAALVVDDAHRTLHAFWSQPLADGAHVIHATAKLK